MFEGMFDELRRMNKRQLVFQLLNFLMIVSSALMIWKGAIILTDSQSPIVVVLSGSMKPALDRGDILFLTNYKTEPVNIGDTCVFEIRHRDIPIVHRVLRVHDEIQKDGTVSTKYLTKGDNNQVDDRGLYAQGQTWVYRDEIVGCVKGYVPSVGMITIWMNDYPQFKYFLLAFLGLFVLVHKE